MPDFGGNVARMTEFSALLELGLSRVFKDDIPTHPKMYTDWLYVKKAKEFTEDELLTTGLQSMPEKTIGGPVVTDKPFISSTVKYDLVPHALGFVGEYELIRWDKYGVFSSMTKKLSRSGIDRYNVVTYAILNNAFSTSDSKYTIYNAEALCATSHVLLRSGTGQNRPSTDVDVTYLGMQQMITDFALLVNEDNLYINVTPAKVIVHPQNRWKAEAVLQSSYREDTANMSKNTLSSKGLSIHDSPYLTNTARWFAVADKSLSRECFCFSLGDDLEFRRDWQASTWNNIFLMYASFRVQVFTWYAIWGTTGA